MGLKEQALAHYNAVVRLDPRREAAWKKLGYKKSGDRWVKPDQLAAEKTAAEHQKLANKHWKPILERYRDGLNSKNAATRTQAEAALAGITDPWAVPAVWEVLVKGDERAQLMAVQVLGQIDAATASRALAALAVFAPSAAVRGRAIDTAVRHDPRDFLTSVLEMIRKPFKYQVRPTGGPGSEGELFVEGERYNIQRLYRVQPFDPSTLPPRIFSPDVPFNPFSVPNLIDGIGVGRRNARQRLGDRPATRPVDRRKPRPDGVTTPAALGRATGSLDPDHPQPRLDHRRWSPFNAISRSPWQSSTRPSTSKPPGRRCSKTSRTSK